MICCKDADEVHLARRQGTQVGALYRGIGRPTDYAFAQFRVGAVNGITDSGGAGGGRISVTQRRVAQLCCTDIQLFQLLRLAQRFCRHGGELSACFKVVVGGATRHGTRVVSFRILRRLSHASTDIGE